VFILFKFVNILRYVGWKFSSIISFESFLLFWFSFGGRYHGGLNSEPHVFCPIVLIFQVLNFWMIFWILLFSFYLENTSVT
jgi:hypothetical protein